MRSLILCIAGVVVSTTNAAANDPFWPHWTDGKAELDGYEFVQPRYGQDRLGRVVLVYVTEPYSVTKKVKVDRYDPSNPDHVTALKLNVVQKFQTGIYDYSLMTSVFVDPAHGFRPMEVSFSSQEWCGHVYEEAHFDLTAAHVRLSSYIEGEVGSEPITVALTGDIIAEDQLLIAVRQLDHTRLQAGSIDVVLLTSATVRRFRHIPPGAVAGTLATSTQKSKLQVPAGEFEVRDATYQRADGSGCTYQVEEPYPHRLIAWRCTSGEQAKLTGSTRLDYWRAHQEGDEKLRDRL